MKDNIYICLSKITIFLGEFSTKPAIVCPKSVSWRSNQEWRSICADTVDSNLGLIFATLALFLFKKFKHNSKNFNKSKIALVGNVSVYG